VPATNLSGPTVRLNLPFLSTSPDTDVKLLFLMLPLWWALGIEQFVYFPLLLFSSVKLLLIKRTVRYQPTLILLLLFTGASIGSLVQVEDPLRFVTFARNLLSYLTLTMLFFVITNAVRAWHQLQSLLSAIVISLGIVGVLGLMAALGTFTPVIQTPVTQLIPEMIRNTDLLGRISERELGSFSWFSYLGKYYRLRGTFLFATMYAAALAMVIPLAALCFNYANRKRGKILYLGIILVLLWNLFFTTGRTAWLALLAGGLLWLVFSTRITLWTRASLIAIGIVGLVLLFTLQAPLIKEETGNLLAARGSSTSDRLLIYAATVEGIAARPLLGWGTERDVAGIPYPAGSHSYMLGILYRHGVAAGALFLSVFVATVWASISTARRRCHAGMNYARWALAVALMISLTEVIDLDVVTLMVLSTVLASVHVIAAFADDQRGGKVRTRATA
jgi:hypothetical protein